MGKILKTASLRIRPAFGSEESKKRSAPSATQEVLASQACCRAISHKTFLFASDTEGLVTVSRIMSLPSTVLPTTSA